MCTGEGLTVADLARLGERLDESLLHTRAADREGIALQEILAVAWLQAQTAGFVVLG